MVSLDTIGVYGIVALIVRIDDAGYQLIKTSGDKSLRALLGRTLVSALPVIIKILGVVGTLALVLVAGGIFIHHIEFLHPLLLGLPEVLRETLSGLIMGLVSPEQMNHSKVLQPGILQALAEKLATLSV